MESFFQNIINLVTTPPGNLAYYLVVTFAIAGTFQAAFSTSRQQSEISNRRLINGLGLLLVIRILVFALSAILSQGFAGPEWTLPVIDRAGTILSLVLIVWLWCFPESSRSADAAAMLLTLSAISLFIFSLIWWTAQPVDQYFNGTWTDIAWEAFSLIIILAGVVLLLSRRPPVWGYGIGALVLLFFGHLIHLLAPLPSSDYAGVVRLAQMAAYPMLFALPQRLSMTTPDETPSPVVHETITERPPSEPLVFLDWLALQEIEITTEYKHALTRMLCYTTGAHLCAIISQEDDQPSTYRLTAYNHTNESFLDSIPVREVDIPVLSNAISRQRPLRLSSVSNSQDLEHLREILASKIGNLLAAPLVSETYTSIQGVILTLNNLEQTWTRQDQDKLVEMMRRLAQVLQRKQTISSLNKQLNEAHEELHQASSQAQQAKNRQQELMAEIETVRQAYQQDQMQIEGLQALLLAQHEYENAMDSSRTDDEGLLPGETDGKNTQIFQLEDELRLALMETAQLKQMLSDADQKFLELSRVTAEMDASGESGEYHAMIASIAQELRHPMSSISGYTDLLLGESIGILGAMQRKFLERIKASSERIGGLVDDLIRISNTKGKSLDFEMETIDLNEIIDHALSVTSTKIREKNILLRVDLPKKLPHIQADRDSLQQVLIHLLHNAGSVSPLEGEIALRVRIEQDEQDEQGYIMFQVTDSGGGIPSEELSRVFSRLYHNEYGDNIHGIGGDGMGLSVAKTLVEAQNGRIWVDSELQKGSTFTVLLPLITARTPRSKSAQHHDA